MNRKILFTAIILPFFIALILFSSASLSAQALEPERNAFFGIKQEIIDPNTQSGVYNAFANNLIIVGNTMIISAHQDNSDNTNLVSGKVYVYERANINSSWELVITLRPPATGCGIPNCTSIIGDYIALGPNENIIALTGWPGTYIYERDSFGNWNDDDYQFIEGFYGSLSISESFLFQPASIEHFSGRRLAIGEFNSNSTAGVVYIFKRGSTDSSWSLENTVFKNGNTAPGDNFGMSVLWNDRELIVGAPGANNGKGAIFVYQYKATFGVVDQVSLWFETELTLSASNNTTAFFPYKIIANQNRIIASANTDDQSGQVFIFKKNTSGNWPDTETNILTAKKTTVGFGKALTFSDTGLVVGAFSQKVYNYELVNEATDDWKLLEIITPSNPSESDIFGGDGIATSGDNIFVKYRLSGTWKESVLVLEKTPHPDFNALKALYDATDGPNWTNTWDLDQPLNSWYGIELNTDSRVNRISLNDNNLNGTLPAEIGDLNTLEIISVTNNKLSGKVPESLATPRLLYWINISHNEFEGKLPDFTGLYQLTYLNVADNNFMTSDIFDHFSDYLSLSSTPWTSSSWYSPQNYPVSNAAEPANYGVGSEITLQLNNSGGSSNKKITNKATSSEDTYQWFKDNILITDATMNSYTIINAQESDSGIYHCEIYNTDIPELVVMSAPFTVQVGFALSVDDEQVKKSISVYPNPAMEYITIKPSIDIIVEELSVYDVLGKKVKSTQKTFDRINISSLKNGIYFIKVKTNLGTTSKRLLIN